MIDLNKPYVSPLYGVDEQGRYRTWPLFAGPVAPEDLPVPGDLPGWAYPVEPLPLLVLPGPLHEEEVGPGA